MRSGRKHLLLLAVFVVLGRCQQKPQVTMSPTLTQVFSGDLLYLRCDDSTNGRSGFKWYFNDEKQKETNKTWQIAVASPQHSGSYQCESNGQKSDRFIIGVLDFVPSASLVMATGQPVMKTGDSVILRLDYEEGLQGWNCWVNRGTKKNKIVLRLKDNSVSFPFHPTGLTVPETIFWCTDKNETRRSNQVTVRTSGKSLSLEMYPLPVMLGESLTLRCLVWGADEIKYTVFYKDDQIISKSSTPTHTIREVTKSAKGRYKCNAIYRFKDTTNGFPFQEVSDNQEVFVQATAPVKAVLSESLGLKCSCPTAGNSPSDYNWYHKDNGQSWTFVGSKQHFKPTEAGTYACRAVWSNKKSLLSNEYNYKSEPVIVIVLVTLILLGLTVAVIALVWYKWKNRSDTGRIYEEVILRPRGDDNYESLQRGAKREREYDTLHPEAHVRVRKEGEYQTLNKDEMKEGVYHSLEEKGAAGGGEEGYEALNKQGMKEGVYHSLEMTEGGAVGGDGIGRRQKDAELQTVNEKEELNAEKQKTEL